jgi:hypothetical protein
MSLKSLFYPYEWLYPQDDKMNIFSYVKMSNMNLQKGKNIGSGWFPL